MYIVREIFCLQFGRYKEAKALMDEAAKSGMMTLPEGGRLLTDFTGDSYRLIMEHSYNTLADFETDLTKEMNVDEWQKWYEKFKPLVRCSQREILKLIK
jgi:hypothetical protein